MGKEIRQVGQQP